MFPTLRARLLLLGLVAVLPALGLLLYTGQLERRADVAAAGTDAQRLARLVAGDIERLIENTHQLLFGLSQFPEVRADQASSCDLIFADLLRHNPLYANLGVADASGQIYCSAVPLTRTVNIADREYFRSAADKLGFAVGAYQVGRVTGKPAINFGQPVLDASGRLTAVAFAALDVAALNQSAANVALPPDAALVVVDARGTVLARYPNPQQWAGRPAPDAPVVQAALTRQGSGLVEAVDLDGRLRLYAFSPVGNSEGEIYVGIGIPDEVAYAGANRRLTINLIGLGLVALLALAAAWWGGEAFVVRRIRGLARATQRLAAGDLTTRASEAGTPDELGQLARAFDQMAAALQRREAEHHLAEATAKEHEASFRLLFANNPLPMWVHEAASLAFLEVNEAAVARYGYSRQEFAQMRLTDIDPEDGAAAWLETVTRLDPQNGSTKPRRLRRSTGDLIDVEIDAHTLEFGGRPAVLVVARDVTERRQREREQAAIVAVASSLRQAHTRAEMLPVLLDEILQLFDAAGAALDMVDRAADATVVELGRGRWEAATGARITGARAIDGAMLAGSQAYATDTLSAVERALRPELLSQVKAVVRTPLIVEAEVIGSVWVGRQAAFTPGDVRLLSALADMAASAIHRATLHEQTQRRVQRLAALHAIDLALAGSHDRNTTLAALLAHTTGELAADAAAVVLLDASTQKLSYVAGRGFRNPSALRVPDEASAAFQADPARFRLNIPGLPGVAFAFLDRHLLEAEGFATGYAALIVAEGQLKGFLCIFYRSALEPEGEWLDFLEALAGQAALAVDNAELFEGLQGSNRELAQAYSATIEGWSRALDLRDRETEGHTQRVTKATLRLARAMGVGEPALDHIRRGALLHDIGKMGIPDKILLKPGALTEAEWAVMRLHPGFAYDLLMAVAYLRPALDIPYCHHEKWDGTGYPRGLRGQQIPLAARIFAVVDVWDALRSDRPYRQAWPGERVRAYLLEQAGQHFDPRVVEAFVRLLTADAQLID